MMKHLSVVLMLIFSVLISTACTGAATDDEVLTSLAELAPRAKILYDVIYGDTLAHGEAGKDKYSQVLPSAQYQSIANLRADISEVFTPEYGEIIANTAFVGVSEDEGRILAKFIERDGVLFVNTEVTNDFGRAREFDITRAKVIKKNPYMASVLLSHEDGDIEVMMKKVDGKWLIDSPMF